MSGCEPGNSAALRVFFGEPVETFVFYTIREPERSRAIASMGGHTQDDKR